MGSTYRSQGNANVDVVDMACTRCCPPPAAPVAIIALMAAPPIAALWYHVNSHPASTIPREAWPTAPRTGKVFTAAVENKTRVSWIAKRYGCALI